MNESVDDRPILFCVPHAGGSATAFMKWRKLLEDLVEVVPVELAGRGVRMREPLMRSASGSGADVAAKIDEHLLTRGVGRDYFIWGHSMGSLVTYEAYNTLRWIRAGREDNGEPVTPAHIVFSGRTAPHIRVSDTSYYLLEDDDDFISAVDTYGGRTGDTLRASRELRDMFLPILRADFEVSETYVWADPGSKIDSQVTILNGADDQSITHSNLSAWQDLVEKPINEHQVPGGHFFLYEQDDLVWKVVKAAVAALPVRNYSTTGKAPR